MLNFSTRDLHVQTMPLLTQPMYIMMTSP
jgi:hypothetical protein